MSYVPKTVDPKTAAAARRFMRLAPAAQAEALAAYQRLPGESTMAALEAEVAALKRRVRLARAMLLKAMGPLATGTTAWRLLDMRRPLPKKGTK